jgi:hypothetical protein
MGPSKIVRPEINRYLKALIFSPPGHGKTRLLGSANQDPRTYPILLLDYEGGTSSLVGSDPPVDVWPIRSWEDYNEAYSLLKNTAHGYKSVALDSISEIHIFALMKQLDEGGRSRKNPDLLEQGDYGTALVQMRRLLWAFRDLPLHIFASSLVKEEMDPREGSVKKPALAGAFSDEAPGIFDVVSYLALTEVQETNEKGETVNQAHRMLILQNYPKFRTKVRAPITSQAPDEIWDPTVTSILDILGFPQE